MDEQVVNRMCERIMGFFERPPSYGGRFKALALAECAQFPNAFADSLVAHFKGLDRWPQNVAREIGMAWGHWRESNPQMCARINAVDCDVCGGRGWLEYVEWRGVGDEARPYTGSCLCGHCRRDPTAWTVAQCAQAGRMVVENATAEMMRYIPKAETGGSAKEDFFQQITQRQPSEMDECPF